MFFFFFFGLVYYLPLGPVSQSNALYDMALFQGFGPVYNWAYWSMYAQRSPRLFACG